MWLPIRQSVGINTDIWIHCSSNFSLSFLWRSHSKLLNFFIDSYVLARIRDPTQVHIHFLWVGYLWRRVLHFKLVLGQVVQNDDFDSFLLFLTGHIHGNFHNNASFRINHKIALIFWDIDTTCSREFISLSSPRLHHQCSWIVKSYWKCNFLTHIILHSFFSPIV